MLKRDEWLSQYFPDGAAYLCLKPFVDEAFPKGFFSVKVQDDDRDSFNQLVAQGFQKIEVLLTFSQKHKLASENMDLTSCRFAVLEDQEQVLGIARNAFTLSRFYQDPLIPDAVASRIKKDWTGNYFSGLRGTHMIVCNEAGDIAGFMILLNTVIDLIAVSPKYQRRGIALKMIAFANQNLDLLQAGTQSFNHASIRMYQKAGFILEKTQLVLHKHVL